jgi:hypothetical protein
MFLKFTPSNAEEKEYLKACKTNNSGFGRSKNMSKNI